MLGRQRVLGFEQGSFYENQPTTSDITIDGTSARSGNYGLHVAAQSGVKTFLSITTPNLTVGGAFFRAYIKVISRPTTARSILTLNSGGTPGNAAPDILLNPDGTVSLRGNGVINATSTIAIALNTWTRLELGLNCADKMISVCLDGATAINYTLPGGSATNLMIAMSVGAMDTVASAFEYYLDDIAFDQRTWPGDGKVIARKATAVLNDNANYTIVGSASTKWQAISQLPPLDDTSYLNTGTSSGQTIDFTVEGWPTGATQVNGSTIYGRLKNDVSNALLTPRPLFGNFDQGTDLGSMSSTSAWQTLQINAHESPLGPFQSQEIWNSYAIRLSTNNANAGRLAALWFEVDYTTLAGLYDDSAATLMTTFENGKEDVISTLSAIQSSGTVEVLNSRSYNGNYALRLTHASGDKSNYGPAIAPQGWTNQRELNDSVWMYIESLPTSGTMGVMGLYDGVTTYYQVIVGADGSITTSAATTTGTKTDAPAGTIAAGTWRHLSVKYRCASSATSVVDGFIQVYLDNVLVASQVNCNPGATSFSSAYNVLGSTTNVTGGAVVWYDDWIIDAAVRHTSKTKLALLTPSGAGTFTDATYTVVGASGKYQALQDVPNDGDTSYVLTPATTNVVESYAMANLPSVSSHVYAVINTAVAKRDAATNGSYKLCLLENGKTVGSSYTQFSTTSASYASNRQLWFNAPTLGAWTPTLVNGIETIFLTTSTIPERLTATYLTVAYSEVPTYARVSQVVAEAVAQGPARAKVSQIVAESVSQGAARARTSQVVAEVVIIPQNFVTNTKEVVGTGIVQITNTKQITGDGIVAATESAQVVVDGVVKGTDALEVVADGFASSTQTRDLEIDALVQETNILEISADGLVQGQQTRSVIADGVVLGGDLREVLADGLVQTSDVLEIDADGVVLSTERHEVEADGVVQSVDVLEVDGDAVVQETLALDLASDGVVLAQETLEIETDGVVQALDIHDVEADGVVQAISVQEVEIDGLVQETNDLEVEADAYVIKIWDLDVLTDAVVHASSDVAVEIDGYCAGIDGILLANIFASNRITAIPFVLGSSAGGYINFVYPQPQDRTGTIGASKRIALLDLNLDGVLYEALTNGDSITYTIYNADGSQYQGTRAATWYIVYYDTINQPVYGWTDIITLPDVSQKLKIVWSIKIGELVETIIDQLEVTT